MRRIKISMMCLRTIEVPDDFTEEQEEEFVEDYIDDLIVSNNFSVDNLEWEVD